MARRCELTGKGTLVGNNVSHANNKTKRIYRPNLQTIDLVSETLGNSYKLKIAMNTLRSVDKVGGLDVKNPRALFTVAGLHDGVAPLGQCACERVTKEVVVFNQEDGGHDGSGWCGGLEQPVDGRKQVFGLERLEEKRVGQLVHRRDIGDPGFTAG